MDKELYDYVAERVDILAVSPASTQLTQDTAKAWKEAVEADASAADVETEKLLDYLETRMKTIDDEIAFFEGPAKDFMGEEAAAAALEAQKARKAAGGKYCDCEMHTAAAEILAKFGRIEL